MREIVKAIQADGPSPLSIGLARNGKAFELVLDPEKRSAIYSKSGLNIVSGAIVPPGTTQAEVDRMLSFDGRRYVSRIFPSTHYSRDPEVFYGGFEMFMLKDPIEVTVGGIENGPAARAGVHWGDVLISANGTSISGKTEAELEALFTSKRAAWMHLEVNRLGLMKTFDFRLDKAEDIAHQNGKRFVDGEIVPIWATAAYPRCFLK